MPEYRITKNAGPSVAGRASTGAGTTIFLTPKEAAHDLRVGALEPVAVAKPSKASASVNKKGGASA